MKKYTFLNTLFIVYGGIVMIQFVNNFLKKSNKIGFFFVLILGTLLHFSFTWLREAPVAGLFSAVNESTWEHMKLLFFPSFLYFLLEYKKYGSSSKDLLTARTLGLFCGLAFIPVSFYTYTGVIGKGFFPVDIAIFAVSVFLTFYASTRFLAHPLKLTTFTAFLLLFALLAAFLTFTFFPPHIQLFLDPVDFTYGI